MNDWEWFRNTLSIGVGNKMRSLASAIDRLADAIGGEPENEVRIVFRLGRPSEQTSAIEKTPQFQSTLKGEVLVMIAISATQNVPMSVEFRDRKGNIAEVDSPPEWFVDNSELLALTPGADGLSCLGSAVGPLGTAKVSLRADADLGDGVQEVVGTLDVEITGGPAHTVEIVPGTPEEQPV